MTPNDNEIAQLRAAMAAEEQRREELDYLRRTRAAREAGYAPSETLDDIGRRIYGQTPARERREPEPDELTRRAQRMYGVTPSAVYGSEDVDRGTWPGGQPLKGEDLGAIGRRMYRR